MCSRWQISRKRGRCQVRAACPASPVAALQELLTQSCAEQERIIRGTKRVALTALRMQGQGKGCLPPIPAETGLILLVSLLFLVAIEGCHDVMMYSVNGKAGIPMYLFCVCLRIAILRPRP